jgi:GR25 family glycosyltransferase involved in LPS biosynthesis
MMRIQDMPCYCITLARRPDRWNRFAAQQEVAQLPKLKKAIGVDGKTIDIVNDKRINPFTKRNILYNRRRSHEEVDSIGAIGCALSHYNVWKDFLQTDAPYAIYFEDDAVLPQGFIAEMNLVLENDPMLKNGNFDVLTFSRVKKFKGLTPNKLQFAEVKSFALAHALIISRRAAEQFCEDAFPVSHHIDFYMSIECMLHKLKIVGSPSYTVSQAGARSDIQTRPTCPMCDIPTDFDLNYSFIPHGDWYRAKASEYALLAILLTYIGYRFLYKTGR